MARGPSHGASAAPITDIIVTRGTVDSHFSLEDVADAIGNSLTDLMISRSAEETTIFTEENRQFVSDVAHSVANSLTKSLDEGGRLRLSEADLYLLIEKALLGKRGLRCRQVPRLPPLHGEDRHRRCPHRPELAARPPDPPQWQRRPVVRDQDRDRR